MRERLSGSTNPVIDPEWITVTTLPAWFEITSLVVVLLILAFDLIIAYKRPHVPSTKESSLWVSFYVGLALVFAVAGCATRGTSCSRSRISRCLSATALAVACPA